jgi:HAD superfamily hydrolase (TIGR01549 family)
MESKLLVFDFDGTIVHTEPGIIDTTQQVLSQHNVPFNTAFLKTFIGKPLSEMFANFSTNEKEIKQMVDLYRQIYGESGYKKSELFQDFHLVLTTLKAKGHILTIATSKKRSALLKVLELFELKDYFEMLIAEDDVDFKKPHPEGILRIKSTYPNFPTVVIGDTHIDIEMARNSCSQAFWVDWGYQKEETLNIPPDFIIRNPIDLCHL